MEDEKQEKGFAIKDRRLFDETGEVRKDPEEDKIEDKAAEVASEQAAEPQESTVEPDDHESAYLPEVNFANFILSLSTTVMYHFGDFPDPVTQKPVKNLQAAKHAIDTMGLLRSKTEGNLDENEKNLLDSLLFELRMRYVKESTQP